MPFSRSIFLRVALIALVSSAVGTAVAERLGAQEGGARVNGRRVPVQNPHPQGSQPPVVNISKEALTFEFSVSGGPFQLKVLEPGEVWNPPANASQIRLGSNSNPTLLQNASRFELDRDATGIIRLLRRPLSRTEPGTENVDSALPYSGRNIGIAPAPGASVNPRGSLQPPMSRPRDRRPWEEQNSAPRRKIPPVGSGVR